MSVSIGVVLGGGELAGSPIDSLLIRFTRELAAMQGRLEAASRPEINIVFYVPGSQFTPDFSGLRLATFRRREGTLMVQIALSADQAEAAHPKQLLSLSSAALRLAEKWLRTRFPYDSAPDLEMLDRLGKQLEDRDSPP